MENRTVREFVEDYLTNGRTPKQILVVAMNTHWKGDIEEIKEIIRGFSKILKKKILDY